MNIKQSFVKVLFLGIFILTTAFPNNAGAVVRSELISAGPNYQVGDLLKIKGVQGAAVYQIGSDGKKYVFPDSQTYFTWYDNFKDVIEVELDDLDQYNDGGIMTFQPGTKLVTHQSTAKVYAVGEGGYLTHILDEPTAIEFYGNKWSELVTDVGPGIFSISYKVNKKPLEKDNLPVGTLIEEKYSGDIFIIEDRQRKLINREELAVRNLDRKNIIKLEKFSDIYREVDDLKKVITFEDILDELPSYNMGSQHALISFKGISWDNDGISGGTGWGVYNTSNSQPYTGRNYVINRHGINFLGFTFSEVVNFKGAYFAMTVTNAGMDINDPNGHSAVKLRYHFYDDNLNFISTSDWFDLQATPKLFAADIDVKRVVIEHDVLNPTIGGFNTKDAEWFSMDNVIYVKKGTNNGNPLDRAYTLYRDHLTCGTDEPVRLNEKIQLRDTSGRILYGNFTCTNRYQSQCIADGSFDTYYKEYCTDINGEIIEIEGEDNPTLPDLKLNDIVVNPFLPSDNSTTTITGYIKNNGGISITDATAIFDTTSSFDDFYIMSLSTSTVSASNPLDPGESASVVWTGYFTSAGTKSLTIITDSSNSLVESNETNNTRTEEVSVVTEAVLLPDLMAYDVTISSPIINTTTTISYHVKNSGNVTLTSGIGIVDSVVGWSSVLNGPQFISYGMPVRPVISTSNPLEPGEVVTITVDGYFDSAGEVLLNINVDPSSQLEESDETNNIYTESFTIILETDPIVEEGVAGVKEYSDGTLLRGPNNKIYILENGYKIHIRTLEELLEYIGQEIINVSYEVLGMY